MPSVSVDSTQGSFGDVFRFTVSGLRSELYDGNLRARSDGSLAGSVRVEISEDSGLLSDSETDYYFEVVPTSTTGGSGSLVESSPDVFDWTSPSS